MKPSQAGKLKELARENARLKKAVAELTLDKLIFKEAAEGHSEARLVADDVLIKSSASSVLVSAGLAQSSSSIDPLNARSQVGELMKMP